MGESNQRDSSKGSTLKKPKMTKEERKAKYTAIARKRREKQRDQSGGFNKSRCGNKQIVCFQCRKTGHTVANCPLNNGLNNGNESVENSTSVLCYRCGSTEHNLAACEERKNSSNELPYAKCYICSKMGHLSSQCSENKNGIYVNGGSCRYCGSTEHLASNCPDKKKKTKRIDPVEDTDINDLLEKPKDASGNSEPPQKKTKKRVVKF